MAVLTSVIFVCVFILWTSAAAPVSADQQEVTVKAGDDVTLQCRGPTDASIVLIEWNRSDLKSDDYVFFYRENRQYEHYQHPSFHGRVKLRDPEMKDGDASVILKNVTVNDTGTYKCVVSVRTGDTEFKCSIKLKVEDSDQQEVTVKAGDDATLQCRGPTDVSIVLIEWNRSDLKSDLYVFFYRENHLYEQYQHPSFSGRVELKDPEMKDGDASVVLKNVTVNNTGTYECVVSVRTGMTETEFKCSIKLKVEDSGHSDVDTEDFYTLRLIAGGLIGGYLGGLVGGYVGVLVSSVFGMIMSVCVYAWIRRENQSHIENNPHQPADTDDQVISSSEYVRSPAAVTRRFKKENSQS